MTITLDEEWEEVAAEVLRRGEQFTSLCDKEQTSLRESLRDKGKRNSPEKMTKTGERFALRCAEERKFMRESLRDRGKRRYPGNENMEPVTESPSAGEENHQVERPLRVDRVKSPERKRSIPIRTEKQETWAMYSPSATGRPFWVDRVKSPERENTNTEKYGKRRSLGNVLPQCKRSKCRSTPNGRTEVPGEENPLRY